MAKEVLAAKLASRGKAALRRSIGQCACGGELIWTRAHMPRARMVKLCEKCGTIYPRES